MRLWPVLLVASALPTWAQVDYGQVGLESFEPTVRGIVECNAALDLAFAAAGVVETLDVDEGDTVTRGAVLMRLDQRIEEIEAERRRQVWLDRSDLVAVEAQIALAREQLAAAERIYEQSRGISLEEKQNRKLSLDLLLAEETRIRNRKAIEQLDYDTATETLARRSLRAPVAGTVSEILRDTGESVQAADVVVKLCDTSRLIVTVNMPAARAAALTAGATLAFEPQGGRAIAGRVIFLSPVIDAASGLRRVRVELTDPPGWLRPGSTLGLRLETN